MLELKSTNKGLLITGMTTARRAAIPSPAIGLLIFNTTTSKFNYYKATGWYEIESTFISSTTGNNSPGGGVAISQAEADPNNSAVLDVSSDTRGILVPRTKSDSISAPATGLIIYNNSLNHFSYYATAWINLCDSFITTTVGAGSLNSQGIAINKTEADADQSAILDITATNAGLLIPRMTTTERDLILPVAGLLVYNTTTNTLDFYSGTSWNRLESNVPPTPGSITGSAAVCSGKSGLTYSISSVTGASGYTWSVPSGSSVTSGQGTTSITVTYGSASGNVSVTANNACGSSTAQTKAITVTTAPTATISYAGTPYCTSVITAQSVTLNGTGAYTGGTYSASPSGLTINASTGEVTPGTSTANTYTVTYIIPASGGCDTVHVTTSVTVSVCGPTCGSQVWAYTNINVGTMINAAYGMGSPGGNQKYCYNNVEANCTDYGGLYQWGEAMNYASSVNCDPCSPASSPAGVQGICPSGYHVPSDLEWSRYEWCIETTITPTGNTTLSTFQTTNMAYRGTNTSGVGPGDKMKATSNDTPAWDGTNTSGFAALPAHYRTLGGAFLPYSPPVITNFWSATESGSSAYYRGLKTGEPRTYRHYYDKAYGFSLRCMKD